MSKKQYLSKKDLYLLVYYLIYEVAKSDYRLLPKDHYRIVKANSVRHKKIAGTAKKTIEQWEKQNREVENE